MSRSARKITQTFNGRNEWQVGGAGFFKLLSTINPVDVELYDRGGSRLIAEQVEGGFYQRIEFDRVVITTGANEQVAWMYGPDEAGSDRFTGNVSVLGTVDVSDRAARLLGTLTAWVGKNRVGSPGFLGASSRTPASQMQIQLMNPAASGKTLYLDRMAWTPGTAGIIDFRWGNVALATLEMQGGNKTINGAAAVGAVRYESNAAAFGTLIGLFASAAVGFNVIEFEEPIIIPQGFGVNIRNPTAASNLTAAYEWREV